MLQTFIYEVMYFDTPTTSTLSQEEHVAALERELYTLRCLAEVFDDVKILHAKAYQSAPPPATNDNAAMPSASAPDNKASPVQTTGTAKTPEPPVASNVPMVDPPLYPYSGIPSHYQPPIN